MVPYARILRPLLRRVLTFLRNNVSSSKHLLCICLPGAAITLFEMYPQVIFSLPTNLGLSRKLYTTSISLGKSCRSHNLGRYL